MGTNYFLEERAEVCPTCNRGADDPLHIGKSSVGWVFALRVYPEGDDLPQSLGDWRERFDDTETYRIVTEYGDEVSPDDMLNVITDRRPYSTGSLTADMLQRNNAEVGPRGLLRHRISDFCIGHGDGTYDLMGGDFR